MQSEDGLGSAGVSRGDVSRSDRVPAHARRAESRSLTGASAVREGIIAGVFAAIAIAVWFLILDAIDGRPLYTPTVLGTAYFDRAEGADALDNLSVSIGVVLQYSIVHWLVFAVTGAFASFLLTTIAPARNLWTGALLFFVLAVVMEFGFRLAGAVLMSSEVLYTLAWPRVLMGNLLGAAAMGVYLLRRHNPAGR